MALAQTNTVTDFGLKRVFAALFGGIVDFLEQVALASSRIDKINALQALTDEQLAERGMKREDIVRVVFADRMGI